MKILGIETSCDETACAIVEDGRRVLANVIDSQIKIHEKTGGVVPEVAAREHLMKIVPVIDKCLSAAGMTFEEIDAVAVTEGPGLIGSLVVGTEAASVISYVKNKPLIPVHHIAGHLYSNWLEVEEDINFPVLILTVSGGHNQLVLMRGDGDFEILGETLDDASGEAFDKVAKLLGLGYPGGPIIGKMALEGDKKKYSLPRVLMEKESLDFSFSGLKTAVLNEVMRYVEEKKYKSVEEIDVQFKQDLSASFQEAVCETLTLKLLRAIKKHPDVKEIHLAGGVSANSRLREWINDHKPEKVIFRFPKSMSFCTDNAAMIAGAAYFLRDKIKKAPTNVVADSSLPL